MTRKLEDLIDEYAIASEKAKSFSATKGQLRAELLEKHDLEPESTYHGNTYDLDVVEIERITLDPKKVAKIIGMKAFLDICSVSIESAKGVMTPTTIDQCIDEVTPYKKLTTKKRRNNA